MKTQIKFIFLVAISIICLGIVVSSCKEEEDSAIVTNPADTTPPTVVSSFPADSSTDIPLDTSIFVTYSEVMDTASITSNTSDTSCSGTIQLSPTDFSDCIKLTDPSGDVEGMVFTITPNVELQGNTTYKLKVTTGPTDIAGNALVEEYVYENGFMMVSDDISDSTSDTTTSELNDAKEITAFSFTDATNSALSSDVTATISGTNITAAVPFGTDVTALVAAFTITGPSVTVESATQVSGTTTNDFSSAVTYTVTAVDSSTEDYVVSVTVTGGVAGDSVNYSVDSVLFTMVYIPGGLTFPTGTDDLVTAKVTDTYLIGQTEVTYELWSAVHTWAISNDYTFANAGTQGDSGGGTNQHPVTMINWRDAMVWLNAFTEYYNFLKGASLTCSYYSDSGYTTPLRDSSDGSYSTSLNPTLGGFDDPYVKLDATGFRLLTSDEWELAARYIDDVNSNSDILDTNEGYPGNYASGATADYTDAIATGLVAVYSSSSTAAVKSKSPNALGLYDMSGNLHEWSFELSGSNRVARGGNWDNAANIMQVGYVISNPPWGEGNDIGLRLARTH
jgi:formylglycine-generating enzyme